MAPSSGCNWKHYDYLLIDNIGQTTDPLCRLCKTSLQMNGWKSMRTEDSSVELRSFHLLRIGKWCKLQFTKLKTPNKDVPSNTLPKVMEDEGQVEVVGLSFIFGWTFQTLKRGLHTVAHNGDRNLLSLDGVAVNPIQYKHVLKIVFFSSSQK